MNGKGDKQRPTNKKRYNDNFDKIFKTTKKPEERALGHCVAPPKSILPN